jgi:lipoic acid synthetase
VPDLKQTPLAADSPRPRSGEKYLTPQGFTAVRDGIKAAAAPAGAPLRKPPWLKARAPSGAGFQAVRALVKEHRLATVCEEAKCPNIGECWNAGTATIMLMGAVCTRACRFCSVDTGNPHGWLDAQEPENAARTVLLMRLKYVVLTSVDRDDLPDGGAAHYAACVRAIKRLNPHTAVEALTPDFQGVLADVATVVDAGIEVFAQNIETVERLTHPVRDPRAGYAQTLAVLAHAKAHRPTLLTKSSLMLGLGETDAEIEATALSSAWQVPWCAPAIAPSRRSIATTPDSTTRATRRERRQCAPGGRAGAGGARAGPAGAGAPPGAGRLPAHLGGDAAFHGGAHQRHGR